MPWAIVDDRCHHPLGWSPDRAERERTAAAATKAGVPQSVIEIPEGTSVDKPQPACPVCAYNWPAAGPAVSPSGAAGSISPANADDRRSAP